MNILERLYFDQPGGMFREFEGINTHFAPKDPDLYRKLLPKRFDVPPQPVVFIFIADYLRVVRWPITRYRYQEWSVLLKCMWNGEDGWFSITMPVTTWIAKVSGLVLGFPKYIAEVINLSKSGQTRLATSIYQGIEQLTIEYCPGITRPLSPWELELLENQSFFKGDAFQLVPAGRGPRAQKVVLRHVVQPKWSPEQGMVRIRVNQNESWAGLVPEEGEFPGTYNRFSGGINLIPERSAI